MAKNAFVGTWQLVSFELRNTEDNQVSYPFGEEAVGYIMYSEDGYMSVSIMSANRSKFASGEIRGGSVEERVAAFDTYFSYCGRYEIQQDKIVHHVETGLFPNHTGRLQERFFEFDNDKLLLSTPPIIIGEIQRTYHLVWQRLSV